ncbi:MAG: isochorismatase family protein [Magnetospirillum sp.]|nr:isochorismatase family protein [Magnetospirillum sp.]
MSTLTDSLHEQLPLRLHDFDPSARATGLVIVDVINGFATIGAGALAPPAPDAQVARMVAETDRLARRFAAAGWPVMAFLDTHQPGKPEPPYPPHCELGSGEEQLVPDLDWLEGSPAATLVRKDCINGFIGAIDPVSGRNAVVEWVKDHGLEAVLVVGICTDICVMDFVLTLLSARNHGLMPSLDQIAVFEPGCATYDLPKPVALSLGLPETAAHPKDITHHAGLYFMAARGAMLISNVL